MSGNEENPLPYHGRVYEPEFGVYTVDVVPRGVPVLLAQNHSPVDVVLLTLMEVFASPKRGFVVSVLWQRPRRILSWPRFVCFEFHATAAGANDRAIELEAAASQGQLVGLKPIGWRQRRRLIRDATRVLG